MGGVRAGWHFTVVESAHPRKVLKEKSGIANWTFSAFLSSGGPWRYLNVFLLPDGPFRCPVLQLL
jgi:hypothetical protein